MKNITVCVGSSCHLKGSQAVIEEFQRRIAAADGAENAVLCGAFCMGKCGLPGVAVTVDGAYHGVLPEQAGDFFQEAAAKEATCDAVS